MIVDISEISHRNSDTNLHLASLLVNETIDDSLIREGLHRYGWSRMYEFFVAPAQPTNLKMRKGRFGEVLNGNILADMLNYEIPVHKLQFTIIANMSLPSTDIIAIKRNQSELIEICFVESKLRTTKNTTIAVEAYKQIKKDLSQRIPDMLRFVVSRLHERQDPLKYQFMDYLMNRNDKEDKKDCFCIGIISESSEWTEQSLENLENEIEFSSREKIIVIVILINELEKCVRECFQSLGCEEIIEDE